MSDTKEKLLPGIEAYIEPREKGFSKIAMLLEATGGLSLSQVCAVTGLEGSTIQNWVKRGWVAHPRGKKYEEVHIARILIINALKECIKLEHIAQLMSFVSGDGNEGDGIIKESELFSLLCEALSRMGQASGVEAVVEELLQDYEGPTPGAGTRLKKALSLMMYACVCTDVKRRTESMMRQVLHELESPEEIEEEETKKEDEKEPQPQQAVETEEEDSNGKPKTVAQTLREWDAGSVEKMIIDDDGPNKDDKLVSRPWFTRKATK